MSKTHVLTADKLYILSGPSASGKSHLTQEFLKAGLGSEAIISSDTLRQNILGHSWKQDALGAHRHLYGWEMGQSDIFKIAEQMISMRLRQRLPVVFDATNLDDKTRGEYVKIAMKYHMPYEILIFQAPIDVLKKRLSEREARFSEATLEKQVKNFQADSRFPHRVIFVDDRIILVPNLLNTDKIDVVGDIHGLKDLFKLTLAPLGWNTDSQGDLTHDDAARKILFLGDIVDRGPDSVDVLRLVKKTVQQQKAWLLLGNHESKLIRTFDELERTGEFKSRSLSSVETCIALLGISETERTELLNFLRQTPSHYSFWADADGRVINLKTIAAGENNLPAKEALIKIAFCHADVDYYNPFGFPADIAQYGTSKHGISNADADYAKGFAQKLNEYILIRGHIPATSPEQDACFSLDNRQAFKGEMMALPLDKFVQKIHAGMNRKTAFENTVVREKSDFNYDDYIKEKVKMLKALDNLKKTKMVQSQVHPDASYKLEIYKYSRKVFYDNLWAQHPLLKKARGLVLDAAGDIVQHPFDKIFNIGENGTGNDYAANRPVEAIEKLNGFLGCVTKYPFKSELLSTTTGSFTSDFVGYINDFISPEVKEKFLTHFANTNETLLFEVIHPKDPHIIPYAEAEQGLWLIGAREKSPDSPLKSEAYLDDLAKKLDLRRPQRYTTTFEEIVKSMPNCQTEGFMLRDAVTGEPLLKLKSDYYLTAKFVGRMGEGKVKAMYGNPEKFKEDSIEEEFFPVVDMLVKTIPLQGYIDMPQQKRVDTVREFIDALREETLNHALENLKKPKP